MCCTIARKGVALRFTFRRSLFRKCSAASTTGPALQDLLHQAAPRYIKALKRERAEAKMSDEG